MSKEIQYVTDAEGNRVKVSIPIEEYDDLVARRERADVAGLNAQASAEPHMSAEEIAVILQGSPAEVRREFLATLRGALSLTLESPDAAQTVIKPEAN